MASICKCANNHAIMKMNKKQQLLLAIIALLPLLATAQQRIGIALPVEGQLQVWDMAPSPPEQIGVLASHDAMPGQCYHGEGRAWTKADTQQCLAYYVRDPALGELAAHTISGTLTFNQRTPNEAYRGLQLNGVQGVDDCGERANCDTIYIAGFATPELAAKAMQAARQQRKITAYGTRIWNRESIDLIVERLD